MVTRDTVEEFWQHETLQACLERGPCVQTEDFMKKLGEFLGVDHPPGAMPSARVALKEFLAATIPVKKSAVLIASFNCPVVADAIIQAGLSVETYDLADPTGRVCWQLLSEQLRPHHSAIVVPHLFGVPSDFRPVVRAARAQGTLIIEDCAHTLGGYIGDQMAGTIGDAAIFSFNYDKPISLGGGGALLVNNKELHQVTGLAHHTNTWTTEKQELQTFINYLRRSRDCIPRKNGLALRILKRALRELKVYRPNQVQPTHGIGPLRAALGVWQLEMYAQIVHQRNANASFFQNKERYRSWYIGPDVRPAWLKQKVLLNKAEKSAAFGQLLQRQGLRVGVFNWSRTIDRYLKRQDRPNAAFTAKYALDIPIHQNMAVAELSHINAVLTESV